MIHVNSLNKRVVSFVIVRSKAVTLSSPTQVLHLLVRGQTYSFISKEIKREADEVKMFIAVIT